MFYSYGSGIMFTQHLPKADYFTLIKALLDFTTQENYTYSSNTQAANTLGM